MGLDAETMVATIASGTTGYFAEFAPILIFVSGILIAFGIMRMLVELLLFRKERSNTEDFEQ